MSREKINSLGEGRIMSSVNEVSRAFYSGTVGLQAKIKVRLKPSKLDDEETQIVDTTVGRALLYELLPEGMSFELVNGYDAETFLKALKLIKPSMSLAGVESTMLLPYKTSHSLLTEIDRISQGITNQLIRFSVGIETKSDLIKDIEQALIVCKS